MNNDITYCSANEQACPLTGTCERAGWRGLVVDRHWSFADFSEELVYHREVSEEGEQLVTCPFWRVRA